jgi:hypothetical protein
MPPEPLNYQPPRDQPPPPTPWWKFRFERRDIPLLIIVLVSLGTMMQVCGIQFGRPRRLPAPTTAPAPTARPTVNVTLPPL